MLKYPVFQTNCKNDQWYFCYYFFVFLRFELFITLRALCFHHDWDRTTFHMSNLHGPISNGIIHPSLRSTLASQSFINEVINYKNEFNTQTLIRETKSTTVFGSVLTTNTQEFIRVSACVCRAIRVCLQQTFKCYSQDVRDEDVYSYCVV